MRPGPARSAANHPGHGSEATSSADLHALGWEFCNCTSQAAGMNATAPGRNTMASESGGRVGSTRLICTRHGGSGVPPEEASSMSSGRGGSTRSACVRNGLAIIPAERPDVIATHPDAPLGRGPAEA